MLCCILEVSTRPLYTCILCCECWLVYICMLWYECMCVCALEAKMIVCYYRVIPFCSIFVNNWLSNTCAHYPTSYGMEQICELAEHDKEPLRINTFTIILQCKSITCVFWAPQTHFLRKSPHNAHAYSMILLVRVSSSTAQRSRQNIYSFNQNVL